MVPRVLRYLQIDKQRRPKAKKRNRIAQIERSRNTRKPLHRIQGWKEQGGRGKVIPCAF
jgi:hypothetical protein